VLSNCGAPAAPLVNRISPESGCGAPAAPLVNRISPESGCGAPAAPLVNRISPESGGRTALAAASAMGHLEIVQVLLYHGADAYIHDDQDLSPLMLAARGGHADVIQVTPI
jgi:ankyrin repeat protein